MDIYSNRRSEHSRSTWAIRHHASDQELDQLLQFAAAKAPDQLAKEPTVDLTRGGAKGDWLHDIVGSCLET